MRTAYLIMAHQQPAHLANLVGQIDVDWADIFVHIDKKCNLCDFSKTIHQKKSRVIFLKNSQRVNIHWGDFSQVQATLNLLSAAISLRTDYSRFCLLSGADYPIKDNAVIFESFCSNIEFIRVDRKLGHFDHQSHFWNVSYFWFYNYPPLIRKFLSGWIPRKCYKKLPLYHGANWWSLTHGCVKHILRFVEENKDYVEFHRRVLSPDEIFFHSIVKNSPFAQNISQDFMKQKDAATFLLSNVHGCHYIDWNSKGITLPKILDIEDYDNLAFSSALFARKFDENASKHLLERLKDQP